MRDINELIIDAYIRIKAGAKRFDLETEMGTVIKAYRAGTIIRIDIKPENKQANPADAVGTAD